MVVFMFSTGMRLYVIVLESFLEGRKWLYIHKRIYWVFFLQSYELTSDIPLQTLILLLLVNQKQNFFVFFLGKKE